MAFDEATLKRFWSKVDKRGDSECWPWIGTNDGRYGQIYTADNAHYRATKMSLEINQGFLVPDGLVICHSCDTPICVNPSHLFAGTLKDNQRDSRAKGRLAAQKMSFTQVAYAKMLLEQGVSSEDIARCYGVKGQSIRQMRHGRKSWDNVAPYPFIPAFPKTAADKEGV